MSAATYLITLTFLLSTPGVAEATAGGLPPAHFLLKDLVLLAASLSLLFASVQGPLLTDTGGPSWASSIRAGTMTADHRLSSWYASRM